MIAEAVPSAAVIGALVNPAGPRSEQQSRDLLQAAQSAGRQLVIVKASVEGDFAPAFAMFAQKCVGALVVNTDSFFSSRRDRLQALTVRLAIPTIYQDQYVEAGGLMSYGSNIADAYRQGRNLHGPNSQRRETL